MADVTITPDSLLISASIISPTIVGDSLITATEWSIILSIPSVSIQRTYITSRLFAKLKLDKPILTEFRII